MQHIAVEKDNLSELNRCIFPISLKYIKLVIPKKHFILALCSFNFYFKLRDLPPSRNFPLVFRRSNVQKIGVLFGTLAHEVKKLTCCLACWHTMLNFWHAIWHADTFLGIFACNNEKFPYFWHAGMLTRKPRWHTSMLACKPH